MNTSLSNSSKCYAGYINNRPVAFIAVIHFPARIKNLKKVHRLVVLPDYQGIGLGVRLNNFIAELYTKKGFVYGITTSTPALINSFKKDKNWKLISSGRACPHYGLKKMNITTSINRITTSWKWCKCGK